MWTSVASAVAVAAIAGCLFCLFCSLLPLRYQCGSLCNRRTLLLLPLHPYAWRQMGCLCLYVTCCLDKSDKHVSRRQAADNSRYDKRGKRGGGWGTSVVCWRLLLLLPYLPYRSIIALWTTGQAVGNSIRMYCKARRVAVGGKGGGGREGRDGMRVMEEGLKGLSLEQKEQNWQQEEEDEEEEERQLASLRLACRPQLRGVTDWRRCGLWRWRFDTLTKPPQPCSSPPAGCESDSEPSEGGSSISEGGESGRAVVGCPSVQWRQGLVLEELQRMLLNLGCTAEKQGQEEGREETRGVELRGLLSSTKGRHTAASDLEMTGDEKVETEDSVLMEAMECYWKSHCGRPLGQPPPADGAPSSSSSTFSQPQSHSNATLATRTQVEVDPHNRNNAPDAWPLPVPPFKLTGFFANKLQRLAAGLTKTGGRGEDKGRETGGEQGEEAGGGEARRLDKVLQHSFQLDGEASPDLWPSLQEFLAYCTGGGRWDDNPLYVFDSRGENVEETVASSIPRHGYRPITAGEGGRTRLAAGGGGREGCGLFPYCQPFGLRGGDLFKYLPESDRPEYKWVIIGPSRSGTSIHTDPRGTSTWNLVLRGRKRWVLLPPSVPAWAVSVWPADHEFDAAVFWFMSVYPRLLPFGKRLGMVELLQGPGDVVYVPAGWWHVVLNLDLSVAVSENFGEYQNLHAVYGEFKQENSQDAQTLLELWPRHIRRQVL